jgi:MFS family permease
MRVTMNTSSAGMPRPDRTIALVVFSGIVALIVSMGIGRFAFTPLLPLMLRDGTVSVATGAEWAAANYAGYLVGALTAARFASKARRGMQLAMAGVAVTTVAVVAVGGEDTAWLGAVLRAASGVFSAWVLVCMSSWGLAELARRQVAHLGAWIFTGVGIGIMMAGLLAWLGGMQPARWLWLEMGLLAVAGAALVQVSSMKVSSTSSSVAASAAAIRQSNPGSGGQLPFVVCYGTFGFGYIVPATFLPAMARQQVSDPLVFGLAWPLFGLAAALSVVAAARWLSAWPRRRVWALAQACMALGTALPLVSHAMWSLSASAVLVGGTFMVATMAGMQWARERSPADPTRLLARMTVAFAVGQIVGPLVVRALGTATWAGWDALAWASALATLLLIITAAWLWRDADAP